MTTTPAPASTQAGPDRRATAAACTTVALWASAFVSIRSAGDAYSPVRSHSAGCWRVHSRSA